MSPDAALDNFAFFVGLRLMGPDARRRLRLSLLLHPDTPVPAMGVVKGIERLESLLDGSRQPETLQDRLDLARAERERGNAPFDPAFWLARSAELMAAGFTAQQACQLVENVRGRVEPAAVAAEPSFEELSA